ncbi:hypothetical protein CDL15_Pgr013343 [Punica granatum]|uniref:Uncharacterized protein n=1 Tax=Punica granatum TaxID=22663 RepID=A0A218WPN7_PUNGR|nr:hypothetical protein CDL15_Pgr013343 [Punica granatum]
MTEVAADLGCGLGGGGVAAAATMEAPHAPVERSPNFGGFLDGAGSNPIDAAIPQIGVVSDVLNKFNGVHSSNPNVPRGAVK